MAFILSLKVGNSSGEGDPRRRHPRLMIRQNLKSIVKHFPHFFKILISGSPRRLGKCFPTYLPIGDEKYVSSQTPPIIFLPLLCPPVRLPPQSAEWRRRDGCPRASASGSGGTWRTSPGLWAHQRNPSWNLAPFTFSRFKHLCAP